MGGNPLRFDDMFDSAVTRAVDRLVDALARRFELTIDVLLYRQITEAHAWLRQYFPTLGGYL